MSKFIFDCQKEWHRKFLRREWEKIQNSHLCVDCCCDFVVHQTLPQVWRNCTCHADSRTTMGIGSAVAFDHCRSSDHYCWRPRKLPPTLYTQAASPSTADQCNRVASCPTTIAVPNVPNSRPRSVPSIYTCSPFGHNGPSCRSIWSRWPRRCSPSMQTAGKRRKSFEPSLISGLFFVHTTHNLE